jgi:AraC-like DNA-binding protein
VPPDKYFLGFIFKVNGTFTADGVPLESSSIVIFPPGTEVGAVIKAEVEWAIVAVEPDIIRGRAGQLAGTDADIMGPGIIRFPTTEIDSQRRRLSVAPSNLRALTNSIDCPSILAVSPAEWIEGMIEILFETSIATQRFKPTRSYSTFRRVEEYLEVHAHRPIYTHELCDSIGLSGRHIRAAFSDAIGIPPDRYLHLIRLHRARELLDKSPSVKYAALTTGNSHLSRFSEHYARLFGERPIDTLLRERSIV